MEKQEGALRAFGRQLSKLREERGISLVELASRADIEPRDMAAIEAGKKDFHIADIFRLAAALDVRPSQLLAPL
jgi:transcriptional regulator with XRE-family HTH domain